MPKFHELIKPASITFAAHLKDCIAHIAGGLVVALAIAMVGSFTGCNSYVLAQIEQDVATSTSQPLIAASVNQDDLDDDAAYLASSQYRNGMHAKRFLAAQRGVK